MTISVNSNSYCNRYFSNATFNYNEELIIGISEPQNFAVIWSSKNGEEIQRLSGHTNTIRYISASPVENSIATCCFDNKLRFWTSE